MSRLSDAIAKYKSEHPDLSCEECKKIGKVLKRGIIWQI